MKKLFLLIVCSILIPNLAFAQAGNIGIFADSSGMSCDLNNTAGFLQLYIVHVNSPGVSGSQFRVGYYGASLTYLGATSPFDNFLGEPMEGTAIGYNGCRVSPVHALTMSFFGISNNCDYFAIEKDPDAYPPGIYVTDCVTPVPNILSIAVGGRAFVNNDGSCPCDVPAEETTWGQVKALYR